MSMLSSEADIDEDPFHERPSLLWRMITGIFKLIMVLLLLLLLGLCFAYYMSQKPPEFYSAAMKEDPETAQALGSQLETNVFDIYNSAVIPTTWQGELSEDEINGWLASELPAKFPELLPENIKDPRVSLDEDQLTIACRCSYKDLHGILVGSFDLFCTDQPNQIAIRIKSIKMGIVPFPVTQFADQVTESLHNSGYESSWTEMEGDPVLLVNVPEDHLVIEEYYHIEIKSFDIKDKKILFTGETIELERDGDASGANDLQAEPVLE
ncbi:hypothetical protein OAG71_05070 [bacterium]|nr:hypothetical protein [bacterium]